MFSCFVTFQEVVKLSTKIWNEQKAINNNESTLKLIFEKEDAISLDSVFDSLDMDLFIRHFYECFKSTKNDSLPWRIGYNYGYVKLDFVSEVIRIIMKHLNYLTDDPIAAPMRHSNGLLSFMEFLVGKERKLTFDDLKIMMLVYSAEVDDLELMKHLQSQGADLNTRKGCILEVAISNRRFNIIKYMKRNGVDINNEEALREASSEVTTLKYLLDIGVDIKLAEKFFAESDRPYDVSIISPYIKRRISKEKSDSF